MAEARVDPRPGFCLPVSLKPLQQSPVRLKNGTGHRQTDRRAARVGLVSGRHAARAGRDQGRRLTTSWHQSRYARGSRSWPRMGS